LAGENDGIIDRFTVRDIDKLGLIEGILVVVLNID
jgi:hypothetical protein